jgi:hypothetical protein
MPISNMQQARQMYEYGGLSAPRQNYGLGSFVKKAVRGVKKVAKSPLGKAALLAAGGYYMGGGNLLGLQRAGATGFGQGIFNKGIAGAMRGGFGNFMGGNVPGSAKTKMGSLSNLFRSKNKAGDYEGFSPGKLALGGLGVASMAPLLMGGNNDDVEDSVEQLDPMATVQSAKNYYSGLGNAGAGLNFMPQKKYVNQNFYAADGGRAGYAMGGDIDEEEEFIRSGAGQRRIMPQTFLAMGGGAGEAQAEQMLQAEFIKYKNRGGELSFQEFVQAVMQQQQQAQGMQQPTMAANGGRMGYAEGGIMDAEAAEMIDMGGQEKDYRDEGGFVAMGGEERADDVPARLSKNEFVFTADAVRQAGGGDIDRGSEVMQNMMDNLEQGGQISQGSQGLGGEEEMMSEEVMEEPDGAQAMYEQQQALQSRMI